MIKARVIKPLACVKIGLIKRYCGYLIDKDIFYSLYTYVLDIGVKWIYVIKNIFFAVFKIGFMSWQ